MDGGNIVDYCGITRGLLYAGNGTQEKAEKSRGLALGRDVAMINRQHAQILSLVFRCIDRQWGELPILGAMVHKI